MKQLRHNQTNASDDTKGSTFGLDGDQFLYLVSGLIASIVVLLLIIKLGGSPGMSLLAALVPADFSFVFLMVFKIGKPPGYMKDIIQKWCGRTRLKRHRKCHTRIDFLNK